VNESDETKKKLAKKRPLMILGKGRGGKKTAPAGKKGKLLVSEKRE